MTPTASGRLHTPRFRLVSVSDLTAAEVLHQLALGADPFDPKLGLALACHAFRTWVDDEASFDENSEPPGDIGEPTAVAAVWPEDVTRPGWGLELTCGGHRLGLFVVARREGSAAAVPLAVPADWLAPGRVAGVCFACVQVSAAETAGDAAAVLFDGWVGDAELARLRDGTPAGEGFVRVDPATLRPMRELHDLLHRRPAEPAPVPRPRPKKWNPVAGSANASTAAALFFAVCTVYAVSRGPTVIHQTQTVEKPVPPAFDRPVVDAELRVAAVRGAGDPVVRTGQKFTYPVRVATRRTHGWVFESDPVEVRLLAPLTRRDDGTLAAAVQDRFAPAPAGWDWFVIVLADAEPAGLGTDRGRIRWLTGDEVKQLQAHADADDDTGAVGVIRAALVRAGLPEGGFDVFARKVRRE